MLVLVTLVPMANAEDGDWDFGASLYGWLPNIEGTLAYDIPNFGHTVEVDAGTLIDNLSFTLQGSLRAQKNGWGVFVDGIYLKEAASGQKELPIGEGNTLDDEFTLNNWILNFGGSTRWPKPRRGQPSTSFWAPAIST